MGNGNIASSAYNTEGKEKSSISEVRFETVVLARVFGPCAPNSKHGAMHHQLITFDTKFHILFGEYTVQHWQRIRHRMSYSSEIFCFTCTSMCEIQQDQNIPFQLFQIDFNDLNIKMPSLKYRSIELSFLFRFCFLCFIGVYLLTHAFLPPWAIVLIFGAQYKS